MTGRRALFVVAAVAALAVMWAASQYGRRVPPHDEAPPAPGGSAVTLRFYRNPATVGDFTVADLDGRPVRSAAFRGKVVLINFWATWCGPCRAEIPDLVALQDKYRDHLQIVGVSEDEAPPDVVKRFATEHKINYPVVMVTDQLRQLFPGVSALPTSFLLDTQSRLVQKHVGLLRAPITEAETRALAGLPVNATIEEVDRTARLKLDTDAQVIDIPGIDLSALPAAKRTEVLQKLNAEDCTCGCDLTVAKCRVDDPACGVSLPLARDLVKQISQTR